MNAFPNVFDLPAPESEGHPEGGLEQVRKQAKEKPDLDRLLEDFVSGREPQTTQWIRLASMVASQSFSCDVVIRVLRPNEKIASGNLPIDKLGVSIARKVGAKYSPGRLKRVEARMEDLAFGPGESSERFSFDKAFLPASARVLVIGDHETSTSTFEAIRLAITQQLPKAEVKSFTLYWLEQHFRSVLQDDRYFLSSASPLSVLSRQANPHRPGDRSADFSANEAAPVGPVLLKSPVPVECAGNIRSESVVGTGLGPMMGVGPEPVMEAGPESAAEVVPKPVAEVAAGPQAGSQSVVRHTEKKPALPRQGALQKPAGVRPWVLLVVLGIVVLGIGFVVVGNRTGMFASKAQPSDASVVPEPTEALLLEPSVDQPAAARPPAVQARSKGPQGIIAVPSAGLRVGPSMDAKALRKSVRSNERVTILRRKPSNAGPDWVQIETKSGTVGWVWSSVVREVRRK